MKLLHVIVLLPVISGTLDVVDIQNEEAVHHLEPRRLDKGSSKNGSESSKSGKGYSKRRLMEEDAADVQDGEIFHRLESRRLDGDDSYDSSKSGSKSDDYSGKSGKGGKGSSKRRL